MDRLWHHGQTVTVEAPASYMVTFKDDGTVEIKADCNNASGTYTQDGADVTHKVGPTTLAACPGDSRGEQFLKLLGDAAQMIPLEGKLYITLKTEGSTMILDAVITTVVDLCGEKALAVNKIEDTLDPKVSAMLDEGLVSLVQGGTRQGARRHDANHHAPGTLLQVNRGCRRDHLQAAAGRFSLPDRQQHEDDDLRHDLPAPGGRGAFHQ